MVALLTLDSLALLLWRSLLDFGGMMTVRGVAGMAGLYAINT